MTITIDEVSSRRSLVDTCSRNTKSKGYRSVSVGLDGDPALYLRYLEMMFPHLTTSDLVRVAIKELGQVIRTEHRAKAEGQTGKIVREMEEDFS